MQRWTLVLSACPLVCPEIANIHLCNTIQYSKLYWSLMRKLQFLLPAVAYYIQRKDTSTHYLELLRRETAWDTKELLKFLEVLAFGTLIPPLRSMISLSNSSLRRCVASFSMPFNFSVTRPSYSMSRLVCQDWLSTCHPSINTYSIVTKMLQDLARRLLCPWVVNNRSRIVHGDACFMRCLVHEMHRSWDVSFTESEADAWCIKL